MSGDTSIERGRLYVSGFIKPDSQVDYSTMRGWLSQWASHIYSYAPDERPEALFLPRDEGGYTLVEEGFEKDNSDEEGRFPFTVTFGFQPISLESVTSEQDGSLRPQVEPRRAP